jgi:hypothetical protein
MELSPHEKTPFAQPLKNILRNPKVRNRVQESPPLAPILNQIHPVHSAPSFLSLQFILIFPLSLGLPSGLFSSGFPTKILYAFLFFPYLLHALPISSSLTWSF